MKRLLMTIGKAAALAAIAAMVFAGSALAQAHNGQEGSVVALHAVSHDKLNFGCAELASDVPCGDFAKNWAVGSSADVFMVLAEADSALGISGVSLGILYDAAQRSGVDVFGYTSCADLQYQNSPDGDALHVFPYSGGGNRLIWVRTTNCQRNVVAPYGVQAVVCALYVFAYSPDQLIVDMNRNLQTPDEFQVVDCPGPATSDLDWPSHAGVMDFGGTAGYNPCTDIQVPAENTTWGKLKNQYN